MKKQLVTIKRDKNTCTIENTYTIETSDGKIICKASIFDYNLKDFDWVLIANVDTNKDYQHQGYATKLLKKIQSDLSKEKPNKSLYVFVEKSNKNAIKLYEKLKFKTVRDYEMNGKKYHIMCLGTKNIEQIMKRNFS